MELIVNNICKIFDNGGTPKTVLRGLTFRVNEGQFVTLLGPSGCGKTTLLTIIAGFQKASSGEVRLNGALVSKPGADRGFVFQDFALFPWMTVRENILFPMKQQRMDRKEQNRRLSILLAMAQLEGSEHLFPSQISGGMKQRTAFIRALAGNPQVLLMDEPLGAIDQQMRQTLQEELESLWLKNRTTVLMVTHDVEEAIYLSDRVLVMSSQEGKLLGDVRIALARPRHRKDESYHRYRDQLSEMLTTAPIKAL
jgi:NitT/TauT family transport system ATP-binding protein